MSNIELTCKFCKNKFIISSKRYNYKIKHNCTNFYCSNRCVGAGQRSKSVEKVCLFCKCIFISTTASQAKKCCSRACSAKYSQTFTDYKKVSETISTLWKKGNRFGHVKRTKENGLIKEKFCSSCKKLLFLNQIM
jgi:hypothetical protein